MARCTMLRVYLLFGLSLPLAAAPHAQAQTQLVTDSVGRKVEIPLAVNRVVAAGPPASVLLYTLSPEKMLGWVSAPRPEQRSFLSEAVRYLPQIGRLTGRAILSPEPVSEDLKSITRGLYQRFYHVTLDDMQLAAFFQNALPKAP